MLTDTTLRQTVHVSAGGDHVRDGDLPGATTTDHWYLLSGVEVWARGATSATAVLGDSLTDGRGSTTNGNDRWPDVPGRPAPRAAQECTNYSQPRRSSCRSHIFGHRLLPSLARGEFTGRDEW